MKLDDDDNDDDSVENEAIKEYIEKENNKIKRNDLKEEKIDNKIENNKNNNEKIDLKDNINRIIKVSKKVDIKPSLKNKKLLSFNDEDEEDE